MNIQSINQNQNFTGRYKMLMTKTEKDFFVKNLLPQIDALTNGKVTYFYGKSPVSYRFKMNFDHYLNKSGLNQEQAIAKLRGKGITVPTSNKNDILWIATGKKDSIKQACETVALEKNFDQLWPFSLFKTVVNNKKLNYEEAMIASSKENCTIFERMFARFVKNNKYTNVKNNEELLNEIIKNDVKQQ